ncbi:MAG: hypothetical protein J6B32_03420 [Spirochaetaceae bacterium]|nr:hypothetical protein [Spirochaetaceae bacterium]
MKKIFLNLLIIFFILLIVSCTKKEIIVENDIEQCKLLEGTWLQTKLTEVTLGSDATDIYYVAGVAKYNTFTTLTFDINQNMQTKITNKLISYESETAEGEFTQEELDLLFNQEIIINAKYVASDKNIQYENTQISVNGSDFIPYDEYKNMNSQAEEKKQVLAWEIKDDKLILTIYINNEKKETEYNRVPQ